MTTKIPYDFMRHRVNLSWRDVQFGLERQLIAPQVAIDKATDRVSESDNASSNEVELASLSESDPILDPVSRLAAVENVADGEDVQARWLYLVLAWLFENRASVNDPLGMVEEVYSDFGYPREIAPFVRYMPMIGPDLGNPEQNEVRLYDRWESYLDEAGKHFARSPQTK
jgi:hypothetical protein